MPSSSLMLISGVTDPDLKVKGTVGLRIADASVLRTSIRLNIHRWLPCLQKIVAYVPAGHPTGVFYVFGERAAELIKADLASN